MSVRASIAARVAGVVGALGYLSGVVDGPLLGVIGGLALLTFGHALAAPRGSEPFAPAAFAVVAGAAGAVALRWGTLDLADIYGVNAVLGPAMTVEPATAAVAAGAALAAASIAVGAARSETIGGVDIPGWRWVELGTVAGALTALFVSSPVESPTGSLLWIGATVGVSALVVATSKVGISWTVRVRYLVMGGCAIAVGVSALVIGIRT